MRTFFIVLALLVALAAFGVFLYMRTAPFGRLPEGERLARMLRSPNYHEGKFRNRVVKPDLTEGVSLVGITLDFLFRKKERPRPSATLPSVKTDIMALASVNPDAPENSGNGPVLVWFGHSSYFLRIDGKNILVDPVFSGAASPIPFTVKAFPGSDVYGAEDLPAIDYLFITHDHWDHLDYATMLALRDKVALVICGLGVGEHLELWGFSPEKIIECDWDDTLDLNDGFTAHAVTSHHFSGRTLRRDSSLWASYVLQTPSARLYLGGDGGYGEHFAKQGKRFGPFDLAVLENGQYDRNWKYSHMQPEETLQAARDLGAQRVLALHNSKFEISNHPWDEPLSRLSALEWPEGMRLLTPGIGEALWVFDDAREYERWWESVR